jgi:hypothetical protein
MNERTKQIFWDFINSLGLKTSHLMKRAEVLQTDSTVLRGLATFISQYSCVATIAYCGAHLEDFDETHLSRRIGQFELLQGVVFHRRRLSCLDGLLNGRPVWVLEVMSIGDSVQDELLSILTTIEALVDTWGPAWKIADIDKPERFKRIGIGRGYIAPAETSNSEIPSTKAEILCHWSSDESETLDKPSFPDDFASC